MKPVVVPQGGRKIVLLISSMNAGGAERVAAALANSWVALGNEVTIVPCFSQGSGQSFYTLNERVKLHWLVDDLPKSKVFSRLLKPLVLRRKLKTWQPDVVVSFLTNVNVTALLATYGLKVPVVVCERTNPLSESHLPFLLSKLRKILYLRAAAVMMQTDAAARDYAAYRPNLKHIPAIANPISAELLEELRALRALDKQGASAKRAADSVEPKVLLSMGRLVELKQFAFLIDCFAAVAEEFPDWQLHIYGSGPLADQLAAQIDGLSLSEQVILKGATKAPWQAMREADAFAMSSKREGFPNVLLEAMANGLPAIAIDCPYGPAELSRNGEVALLVETPDAFIDSLRKLLSDNTLRERLAVQGQAHVLQNYSQEKVLSDWEQLFQYLKIEASANEK